jgi:hypothetical protein
MIKWLVIEVLRPTGGKDRIVREVDAPDKRSAQAEADRLAALGFCPANCRVVSRIEYEALNSEDPRKLAKRDKAKFYARRGNS